MSRIKAGIGVAVAFLGALLAGYLSYIWFSDGQPAEDPAEVLLAATLPDLSGREQALAQWKGKVLVINFWATWCPPCLREMPEFVRMQAKLGDRGLQFVGIAIDNRDKVVAFATKLGANYPILLAENVGITLARRAGNQLGGLPFTVIIDRQGRTKKVEIGALNEAKLIPIVTPMLLPMASICTSTDIKTGQSASNCRKLAEWRSLQREFGL